jgi:(E)-4-hydroxy-3-methylbut-2-enyl-diphosphate synthase
MTNTNTSDVSATVSQLKELETAGCEVVRIAVSNEQECKNFRLFKQAVKIPIVSDIQFDYRLAILSIENGADKIRINPGNIGGSDNVRRVADCAKAHGIPIRIGVNGGSLEKEAEKRYGFGVKAMVESCLKQVGLMESFGFFDLALSLKASNPKLMYDANVELSERTDYPLHLGVTEAGTYDDSLVKSAVGIGGLLLRGIGDTVRVSITGDPVKEIHAANKILKAVGLKSGGIEFISCPTCSRCSLNLEKTVNTLKDALKNEKKDLIIAVMGCKVNGLGEARHADIGLAGGKESSVLFKKGQAIKTVENDRAIEELIKLVKE